ncbi:MAG: hypothetical protein AAGK78_08980, partial [Planctomycetota bacterium]
RVHMRHAQSLLDMGRLDDGFALMRRELGLAARNNRPRWEWANAHVLLACDLLIFGRPEEALQVAIDGQEVSRQAGLDESTMQTMLEALQGIALLDLGRADEAAPLLVEAHGVLGQRWVFPRTNLLVINGRARSSVEQGDVEAARAALAQGFKFSRRQGTRLMPVTDQFRELVEELNVEPPVAE